MKASFAGLARRRLGSLPPGAPTAELQHAKADFIEAVISRNYRAAQAASRSAAGDRNLKAKRGGSRSACTGHAITV
jgi:hypothetical protein